MRTALTIVSVLALCGEARGAGSCAGGEAGQAGT